MYFFILEQAIVLMYTVVLFIRNAFVFVVFQKISPEIVQVSSTIHLRAVERSCVSTKGCRLHYWRGLSKTNS
jgi:hypothetical protein